MAFANGHVQAIGGEKPSAPDYAVVMDFDGDATYPGGGTPAFQAFVRATAGRGSLEVLGITPSLCGLYVPVYDKANDKLVVFVRTTGVEAAPGDLSGTKFNLVAHCK